MVGLKLQGSVVGLDWGYIRIYVIAIGRKELLGNYGADGGGGVSHRTLVVLSLS